MAAIPTFRSSVSAVPTTAVDKQQYQGLGIIGDILDQVKAADIRDREIKDKQWLVSNTIAFKQEQLKKQQEAEMNASPGADGHAERVSQQYDTDVDEFINTSQAPSESARMALKSHIQEYGLNIKANAYQFQTSESARYANENVQNSVQLLGNQLMDHPETYSDAMKSSQDMISTLQGKIPQERILEIQNDANGVLNWAASSGRMKKDPYGELKLLNSGALDSQFDIQKKQSLMNAAESEIRSREADAKEAQAKAYQAFNSDLEIRSINGDLKVPEIEALYHSGKLRPEDRAQYTRAALSGLEAKEKKAASIELGSAFMRGDAIANPYSKDHVEAVNNAATATISSMHDEGKSPQEILGALNGMSVKTGIVPEPAVNFIEGGLMNSNDPQVIASSASALIDTITKKPVAQSSFNEKAISKAHLVNTLSTIMPPNEAVVKANELFYQDDSVKAERKAGIEKIEKDTKKNNGDFGFQKWYGNTYDEGVMDWNVSPATAGLKQKYMDAVRVEYQDTGDLQTSMNIVQTKMNAQLGYSSTGGNRKLMMFPPEKFYSLPMDTHESTAEWQTKQIDDYVKSKGFKDYQRVEVSPHDTVKFGKDGMPNYKVTVIDSTGIPVIVRDNSLPAVWRPDTNKAYSERFKDKKTADEVKALNKSAPHDPKAIQQEIINKSKADNLMIDGGVQWQK